MNFERGKDPKSAMGIGAKANAIVVENVIYARKTIAPSENMNTVTWSFDFETENSPSHCIRILMGIQECELNPDEYAITYVGDTGDYEMGSPIKTEMISDLLGTYVKYRGEYYKIPTLSQIQERQEAIRSQRNRLPNLSMGCGGAK